MEKLPKKNKERDASFRCRSKGEIRKMAWLCGLLLTFLPSTKINAADIPGAATPGGAMPRVEQLTVPGETMPAIVIPPLRERPLAVEEGVKITVRQFVLEGVVEHPGLINVTEVKELVEEQRQKKPSGMTMGQIQLVADEVTNYYRNHGMILARAYVPAQTVTNNIVTLTVLEGKLGAVFSEASPQLAALKGGDETDPAGSLRYSKELLQKPFRELLGQPVVKDPFESALLRLFDYPGLKYNAVVKPGSLEGTADLYLNITEERLFNAIVSVDNYGSDYTGEYRPRLDLLFHNPTKAADRLIFTFIDTIHPNNDLYGGVTYERPLPWGNNSWGIDYFKNSFDVGGNIEDLQLSGESENLDVYLRHSFKRSRQGNISGLLRFASIMAKTTQDDATLYEDDLSVLSAETEVSDYMDQWMGGGVTNLSVNLSLGLSNFLGSNDNDDASASRVGASGEKAPAKFVKLSAQYSRLQKLWTNTSLLFRLKGQATDSMLVSVEQFSIGGPDTVRAYPQAEYLMDQGYFSSVELIFNAPGFSDRPAFFNRTWGELLQVSVFYDTAAGFLKDALANEEESGYLSGVGVGVYFGLPGRFAANVSVATPTGSHDSDKNRDLYTYFKLTYQY